MCTRTSRKGLTGHHLQECKDVQRCAKQKFKVLTGIGKALVGIYQVHLSGCNILFFTVPTKMQRCNQSTDTSHKQTRLACSQ